MTSYNPINYKIHLEPDLVNFTFSGTAEILFEAPQPTAEIVLDLLEIDIWHCRVLPNDDPVDCAFNVDPAKEELRITLPEPVSGTIRLKIDYQGFSEIVRQVDLFVTRDMHLHIGDFFIQLDLAHSDSFRFSPAPIRHPGSESRRIPETPP